MAVFLRIWTYSWGLDSGMSLRKELAQVLVAEEDTGMFADGLHFGDELP